MINSVELQDALCLEFDDKMTDKEQRKLLTKIKKDIRNAKTVEKAINKYNDIHDAETREKKFIIRITL